MNNSCNMKNSFINILFLIAALVSCNKETEAPQDKTTAEAKTYSFQASLGEESRAVMSDAGKTLWEAGDKIAVWDKISESFKTFINREEGGGTVTFSYTGEPGQEYEFTRAVYPASITGETAFNDLTLPSSYALDDASLARTVPLVGTVEDESISFKHLAAILRVNVEGIPSGATTLELSSPTVSLCGNFSLSENGIDDGKTEAGGEDMTPVETTPDVKSGGMGAGVEIQANEGDDKVSIDISGRSDNCVQVYVPLPVGAYSYCISLKNAGDEVIWSKSTSDLKEIQRATLYKMRSVGATLSGGAGTAENPYKIASAADLVAFQALQAEDDSYKSLNYKLTADIDMNGVSFSPIGTVYDDRFTGTFDGDGHTISNLNIAPDTANAGLFGYLSGTVKNLSIASASISATGNYAGAIAGVINGGTVERCRVDAETTVSSTARGAGCIVGFMRTGTINACAVHGSATAGTDCAGGIAGYLNPNDADHDILVINCIYEPVYKDGHLYGATLQTGNANAFMGGIAGSVNIANTNKGKASIINCYAYPLEMKSTQGAGTTINRIGGITGYAGTTNTTGGVEVVNCMTPINYSNIIVGGTRIEDGDKSGMTQAASAIGYIPHAGAVVKRVFSTNTWASNYKTASGISVTAENNNAQLGDTNLRGLGTVTVGETQYTPDQGGMAAALNAGVSEWNNGSPAVEALDWEYDPTFGYPEPQGVDTPGTVTKKVSLMGDSISTYEGYVFSDNGWAMNKHYPNGDLDYVQGTWWWKLIYGKMSNARLEAANAYSGSAVTYLDETIDGLKTFDAAIKEYSFQSRALNYGLGNPDLLIFYGGRNDFAKYGNQTVIILGDYSTESLETAYDTASGVLFNNYSQGAVSILRDFHAAHPQAKVLMIVHDEVNDSYANATIAIKDFLSAKEFDIRLVNIHKMGTTNETNTEIGYTKGEGKGTHPNDNGTTNLVNYIWDQFGSWLDE